MKKATKCSVRVGKATGEELQITEDLRWFVNGENYFPWDIKNKPIKPKTESYAVTTK